MKSNWRNYVGGRWVDGAGGEVIAVENPATGEKIAEIARAMPEDVDRAVAAARACVRSRVLEDMRPGDRGRMVMEVGRKLLERADEFSELLCLDSGKNISQGRIELEGSARYFEYYGGAADKIEGRYIPLGGGYADYTVPVPYGISAQIIPWNYPLEMIARSGAAALAAGNALVIKSPELDPLAPALLAEVFEEVGFPDGAYNVLCGYGHDAGAALAAHPDVDQVVFTGSVPTGQSIMKSAADNCVPTVMELGGKSAGIVLADADLDLVTENTKWGIYFNAGQVCSAMSRLIVHEDVHDDVVDRIAAMTDAQTVGPGIEDHFITPLISGKQLDRVENYAMIGAQEGASAVRGGRRVADTPGHFMQPTVFTGVTPDMTINQEEIFGPVLSIIKVKDDREALEVANGTDYGLASGIFTNDLDRAVMLADRLDAGQVYVNEWYAGGVETPFGGFKKSGFGREKGFEAILNYVQSKNVAIRKPNAAI